jgi:hypothetical protein
MFFSKCRSCPESEIAHEISLVFSGGPRNETCGAVLPSAAASKSAGTGRSSLAAAMNCCVAAKSCAPGAGSECAGAGPGPSKAPKAFCAPCAAIPPPSAKRDTSSPKSCMIPQRTRSRSGRHFTGPTGGALPRRIRRLVCRAARAGARRSRPCRFRGRLGSAAIRYAHGSTSAGRARRRTRRAAV